MILLTTNEILHSSCTIQPFHVPAGEESDGAGGIAQQRARGEAGASVPVLHLTTGSRNARSSVGLTTGVELSSKRGGLDAAHMLRAAHILRRGCPLVLCGVRSDGGKRRKKKVSGFDT